MKFRMAILFGFLCLSSASGAYSDSQFPEITVSAPPEKVIAWFQNILSQSGGIIRSSAPTVNVFETPPQRAGYWEGVRYNLASPTGYGTGQYINRITLNTIPGNPIGTTHVILIEERIMNYGSSFARPLTYKVGGTEYNAGVSMLNLMKSQLEKVEPVSASAQQPQNNPLREPYFKDWQVEKKLVP